MPTHIISKDIKDRVPVLFYDQDYTVKEICLILGIKKSAVYLALSWFCSYSRPYNPDTHHIGRKQKLGHTDIQFICSLLKQQHCIYLGEIQNQLCMHCNINVSLFTLFHTLCILHFSQKSVSAKALEQNLMDHAIFMNKTADLLTNPDQLMSIDEVARNR